MQRWRWLFVAGALFIAPSACASTDHSDLRSRAARDGTVRVIVTLASPESRSGSADAIREAQAALLNSLRGTRYEEVRRFSSVPQIALAVGPDALEVLLSSPHVAAIVADSRARPMTGTP
jgi:hypothetical protein